MDKVFFKDEKVMMWWEYEKDDEQRFGNKYGFGSFLFKTLFYKLFKLHFRNFLEFTLKLVLKVKIKKFWNFF